jgi:type IV pilus assembly protein PilV
MINLKKNGFTLAEVLVSLFVLCVGVIGTAAMQLNALRMSQQTALQTMAIQLASEFADKTRVNVGQFSLIDEANPFLNLDFSSSEDVPAPAKSCHAASCNRDELADFEIHEWKSRIKAALPGGQVRICRDSHPWDPAVGAFKWSCTASADDQNTSALVIKLGWHGKGKNPDGRVSDSSKGSPPPNIAITIAPYAQ